MAGQGQRPCPRQDQPAPALGAISNLFVHADTQAGIRGTRWAGYNALTEYANHVAPVRGKTSAERADARAERVISGAANDLMEKAFALTAV
ncbi:DUF932 domain-containing protein [Streptomyces sp. NPDC059766]|uniref:DUF932 domain-containing protein n=1 Tax=Streptomyces sp. NPDC059766 TaxID=3346940 RepID=UPI003660D705